MIRLGHKLGYILGGRDKGGSTGWDHNLENKEVGKLESVDLRPLKVKCCAYLNMAGRGFEMVSHTIETTATEPPSKIVKICVSQEYRNTIREATNCLRKSVRGE